MEQKNKRIYTSQVFSKTKKRTMYMTLQRAEKLFEKATQRHEMKT